MSDELEQILTAWERQERELDALCTTLGITPAKIAINRALYRAALGNQVICTRCGATAWTFREVCKADLIDETCDGDVAVEMALRHPIPGRATPDRIARAASLLHSKRNRT